MSNFGRDALWDAATWADLDQAVSEEVARVRVARKVFHTEDLRTATGASPHWVSRAEIDRSPGGLRIPEAAGEPLVEISVPFSLTPAQVEAEETLHTARTLARAAAKDLASAEDDVIFRGAVTRAALSGAQARNAPAKGLMGVTGRHMTIGAPKDQDDPHEPPQALVDIVNTGITDLSSAGWPTPYALVLGADLYLNASSRLHPGSEESAADRLNLKLRHCVLSGALQPKTGILVSLAGDPMTVYTTGDARIAFVGQELPDAVLRFRVFERIQYVLRDPSSIWVISSARTSTRSKPR